jgi:hypothetical protein
MSDARAPAGNFAQTYTKRLARTWVRGKFPKQIAKCAWSKKVKGSRRRRAPSKQSTLMARNKSEASLAAWYVAEARRMVARQRQRIGNLKAEGRSAVEAEQTLEVLLSRLELFVRPDPSPFGMAQKVKALLDSAVIRVADSRGFVVEGTEARYVVASANQLPFSPTYYAHKSEANTKHEPLARRILRVIDDPLAAVGRPAPEKPPPFPGPDWAHRICSGALVDSLMYGHPASSSIHSVASPYLARLLARVSSESM